MNDARLRHEHAIGADGRVRPCMWWVGACIEGCCTHAIRSRRTLPSEQQTRCPLSLLLLNVRKLVFFSCTSSTMACMCPQANCEPSMLFSCD